MADNTFLEDKFEASDGVEAVLRFSGIELEFKSNSMMMGQKPIQI